MSKRIGYMSEKEIQELADMQFRLLCGNNLTAEVAAFISELAAMVHRLYGRVNNIEEHQ